MTRTADATLDLVNGITAAIETQLDLPSFVTRPNLDSFATTLANSEEARAEFVVPGAGRVWLDVDITRDSVTVRVVTSSTTSMSSHDALAFATTITALGGLAECLENAG